MTNVLAILLSLAMMLTGASADLAEPVSRTLTVKNLVVTHNGEEIALEPYLSMGVKADGSQAVFDFFIGKGDARYLPFQALVDESGAVVLNDNSNTTMKLTEEDLEQMMSDSSFTVNGKPVDSEEDAAAAMQVMTGELLPAYADLFRLMNDPDRMQEIMQQSKKLYDEQVDRGQGTPEKVLYDGETREMTTYEYDLDGAALGRLCDAMYAEIPEMDAYVKAYFKLLSYAPQETGLKDATNFEALMGKFDVNMHIVESIAEDGLNIMDGVVTMNMPGMEQPVSFTTHSVQRDGYQFGTAVADIDVEGLRMSMYAEATVEGGETRMIVNLAMNPSPEAQEQDADSAAAEPDDAEEAEGAYAGEITDDEAAATEETEDVEAVEDAGDGEGDAEDMIYIAMDFDIKPDGATGVVHKTLSCAADVSADMDGTETHFVMNATADRNPDGTAEAKLDYDFTIGGESFGYRCDISLTDAPIETRVDADKAVALAEVNGEALMASLGADALNLYADEGVQRVIAMFNAAMESADEAVYVDINSASEPATGEALPDGQREAEPFDDGELPYATPEFGWLPEGYAVTGTDVDTQYDYVSMVIENQQTGGAVYVDINSASDLCQVTRFAVDGENISPIEGTMITEEDYGDYRIFALDDSAVSVNLYIDNPDFSADDAIKMLANLKH